MSRPSEPASNDPRTSPSSEPQADDDDSVLKSIGEAVSAPVLGADEESPASRDPVPPAKQGGDQGRA